MRVKLGVKLFSAMKALTTISSTLAHGYESAEMYITDIISGPMTAANNYELTIVASNESIAITSM